MDNVIDTLHQVTTLTNADIFSVMVMGVIIGGILSDGFRALIDFIIKKVKEKKCDG